jgi:hypothetical protein
MIVNNYVDAPVYDFVTGLRLPELRAGLSAPNGDGEPFKSLPIGSRYWKASAANPDYGVWYEKRKNDKRDDDWSPGLVTIAQRVVRADFTDGGSTIGTLTMDQQVPAGAQYLRTVLRDLTGFTGNVSATIQVGDGTDVDRYSAATPSVFTTAVAADLGAPSGTLVHVAAITPVITITASSDFTAVTAGAFTIYMYYYL